MPPNCSLKITIIFIFTHKESLNMGWLLLITASVVGVLLGNIISGAKGDATVSGFVFCDQCKDGAITLFDYPLYDVKVVITCTDNYGQVTLQREETTNLFGSYFIRFDGAPDLSGCQAQVSGPAQGPLQCGSVAGPAQNLRNIFSLFGVQMYTVDPLLSQPAQPIATCPNTAAPVTGPVTPSAPRPPAFGLPFIPRPPPFEQPSEPRPLPSGQVPAPGLPQLPPLPPLPQLPPAPPLPPMPFAEASACPYWEWTRAENRCYWRGVDPSTNVAFVFGLIAARRYGTDMTLWRAIQGRGDSNSTLLREATTALLNSFNTLQFQYNPISVIQDLNLALMGSDRQILYTAMRFRRANSGNGKIGCKFTPCK